MSKTVVGLFSSMSEANRVKQQLISEGYSSGNINVVANDEEDATNLSTSTTSRDYSDANTTGDGMGIGEKISHFFKSLTGGDEDVHHHYASGVNSGGALLAVKVEDSEASEVASMLKQHGARDIEGGGAGTTGAGYAASATGAGYAAGATGAAYAAGTTGAGAMRTGAEMTGEQVIPIVEEELVVGKREVDRGGVRVYSHVTERPAEADVTLREERINVERRPVNRAATAADFEVGRNSTIELNAMSEEAVVGKSSRVVEEVLVGKQSSERTESIHDTVRKTEVEVENVSGSMDGRSKGVQSSDRDLDDVSETGTGRSNERY